MSQFSQMKVFSLSPLQDFEQSKALSFQSQGIKAYHSKAIKYS
jgi:hypothetical protein